jgi:hypothetical protein
MTRSPDESIVARQGILMRRRVCGRDWGSTFANRTGQVAYSFGKDAAAEVSTWKLAAPAVVWCGNKYKATTQAAGSPAKGNAAADKLTCRWRAEIAPKCAGQSNSSKIHAAVTSAC